jgi:hypothetical protein
MQKESKKMDDALYEARKHALFIKGEEEWLRNRISDLIEDAGSKDGTLSGITDAAMRAGCEREIKRTKRDHASHLREHASMEALHRARQMARKQERDMRERLEPRSREPDSTRRSPISTALPTREIFERFNRRTTGKKQ